jgi:hypothetical protein
VGAEISGVAVQTCALPMPVRMEARLRLHGSLGWSDYDLDFAGVGCDRDREDGNSTCMEIASACAAIYVRVSLSTCRCQNSMLY